MTDAPAFSFDLLRRRPDVEAPNLFAVDAADRLILDIAAERVAGLAPGELVVIGDAYGALTLGAAAQFAATGIRVHQDALSGERALEANAEQFALGGRFASLVGGASGAGDALAGGAGDALYGADLLGGAAVVLVRLPRSLDALAEITDAIARHASAEVAVIAGGMVKHMTRAMNDVLSAGFDEVHAGLARQKARVLTATGPRRPSTEPPSVWPRRTFDDELGLWVCAHGAAFAGASVDIGTRFLLTVLDDAVPDARVAIDLGCGTGVVAAALASRRPGLAVIATDQSAAAVASAAATAAANGVNDRVIVVRDDALAVQADASADLIVLNPPFHIGSAVHTGIAQRMMADAGRVLRPGGELWTVWNSHLGYRAALGRAVGPTRQIARNTKFTVTASRRSR